jgi:uncharacterized membrane protein SpoIIM required for sporulation
MVHLPADDIDEMAGEFTQLVDDLGYSKTFYPSSKTTTFLNTEASKRYLAIYKNRREEQNRFVRFFKTELPLTIAKHHKVLLICFLIFLLFYIVGFYSAIKDESIARDILGDAYIQQTEKNIADGNPFGIYQNEPALSMWISIMFHNIEIAFAFFVRGLLFPFFTIQYLVQNAMMVGVFDEFFYVRGLGNKFILAVMIHGTLELSAIVIAAASGIVLGKGWLFPGKLSRLDGFKLGAKDGMKIFIAVVPILMIAAFFEGFVTRHYNNMQLWVNISILAVSAIFIIGYFVIYPLKLKKKYSQVAE